MTLLIRYILIIIIIYLLIRSFVRYFEEKDDTSHYQEHERTNKKRSEGVSKDVGEYTDYEEVE